ncbi:MAG: hypothetical protein ACREV1_16625, partial [Gammaproteobacteria bacterium]
PIADKKRRVFEGYYSIRFGWRHKVHALRLRIAGKKRVCSRKATVLLVALRSPRENKLNSREGR